jgi:hypothetical protein
MRYLKYLVLLALVAVPAAYSQAQVSFGVQVGPGYGYYNGPPVCDYGYYPYYPYDCAPYGYWGPQWFVNGIFIGAGPWYHWYYSHPEFYRGFRGGWDRGFRGGDFHDRGFRGGNFALNRGGGFHGGNFHDRGFRGNAFRGGRGFQGGGGGFRGGGGEFHGGGGFHGRGGGGGGGGEIHGGGGFHGRGGGGGGSHSGGGGHGRR